MTSPVLLLVLLFIGWLQQCASIMDMQNYVRNVPILKEMEDVHAFKILVRRQMYMSVGMFITFWAAIMVMVWSALTRQLGGTLLILSVVMAVIAIGTQAFKKKTRNEVTALPAQDKGLSSLHQALCVQWAHRSLPEF